MGKLKLFIEQEDMITFLLGVKEGWVGSKFDKAGDCLVVSGEISLTVGCKGLFFKRETRTRNADLRINSMYMCES